MAAKRLLEKPPPAYSSSDEGESSDDSDTVNDHEHEEEEEDSQNGVAQRENAKFPEMNPKPESDSDSDSESDSGSDNTNTTPSISAFTIKPSAEPKRKAPAPAPAQAPAPAPTRPSDDEDEKKDEEEEEEEEKKKKKKKRKVSASGPNGGAEDPKSPSLAAFQRVWSEEDEIAILKGMSDFKAERGSDPNADMAGFHDFIRESLQFESSKAQLADKIRRLKKKFLTNAEKDEAALATKPHELRSFELSKKVWGAGGTTPAKKPSSKSKKVAGNGVVAEGDDFWGKFPWLSESLSQASGSLGSEELARTMKEAMPMLGSSKAKELEKKWKKLGTEEMELRVQRCELTLETYKLVLDSVKSSKH